MKKSLIAMALMFGAVVFVASCGEEESSDCKECTITITDRLDGTSPASQVYTNKQYCGDELKGVEAANGANVTGADVSEKGGKYSVSCK